MNPITLDTGEQLDPKIVKLMRAIRQKESGGNYDAVGDAGTSKGAFQFQDAIWKGWAKEILGDENAIKDKANQNKVAYTKIKQWKDQGFTPEQVAAAWNAGEEKARNGSWQNNVGNTVINGQKIKYDTPSYVRDVLRIAKGENTLAGEYKTTPTFVKSENEVQNTEDNKDESLGSQLKERAEAASKALSEAAQGKIGLLSGGLQTIGAAAGGLGDIVGSGLNFVTGGLLNKAEKYIGKKVGESDIGKSIGEKVQKFSEKHPELAGDIGAAVDIASAIPILKGVGIAKRAVKNIGKEALASTIADVAPEVSKKALASGIAKRGVVKSLIKGEIKEVVEPSVKRIAETVNKFVPNFSKYSTFAEKVNATRQAVSGLAEKLKQDVINAGRDRIYSFKELSSFLKNIERPTLLVGDMEKVYDKVLNKALEISKKNGGKISNLFDARKEFDDFISNSFPNLYSSDTLTPMRIAVKNIRQGMNKFIEKNLPEELGFKESLTNQSRLLEAIENMSTKAAKEIGSTGLSRFAQRHPLTMGLIKNTAKIGATGLIGGSTVAGIDRLIND